MIDGHYESFVVRLWVQSGEIARGEVSRTLSGETGRFVELDGLSRFLVESVAQAAGRNLESRSAGLEDAGNADAAPTPGSSSDRVVEMRRRRAAGSEVASDG